MADQVDEVKQKTDIVALVGEYVDLKKAGRNYKALCPFHSEKTPSFMVSPELQIFKCFGCSESGDAIAFLQNYEGMDFYEALKFLADKAGIKLKPQGSGKRSEKERLYKINARAIQFYHYLLVKHPVGRPAFDYLTKKRKLTELTIEMFKLGYSPNKPLALHKFFVDKKKVALADLEKVGLVYMRNGRGIDRFASRVIFPLFDHRENAVGFAGRILPWDKRDVAKYINTPDTPTYQKSRILYGLDLTRREIKKKNEAVVVEGELDMISSWQAGVKNTVAIKGSSLTAEQTVLLSRFAKRLTLALDADIAGDAAARRGIKVAEDSGLEIRVAKLGKFKDPDEMAKEDPAKLKEAVKKAVGVWDFMIDSVFLRHGGKGGAEKAKISREIVPVLASIGDKIVQAHYIDEVARRLSVPSEAVAQQVEKRYKKEAGVLEVALEQKPEKKGRRQLLEERLLTIAFNYNPKVLKKKEYAKLITTPLAKRIFTQYLKEYGRKGKKFEKSKFAKSLPEELVSGFEDLILKDIVATRDRQDYNKELKVLRNELETVDIKDKITQTTEKIREYEKKNKKKDLERAKKRFGELTRLLTELEGENLKGIIL